MTFFVFASAELDGKEEKGETKRISFANRQTIFLCKSAAEISSWADRTGSSFVLHGTRIFRLDGISLRSGF